MKGAFLFGRRLVALHGRLPVRGPAVATKRVLQCANASTAAARSTSSAHAEMPARSSELGGLTLSRRLKRRGNTRRFVAQSHKPIAINCASARLATSPWHFSPPQWDGERCLLGSNPSLETAVSVLLWVTAEPNHSD